MEKRYLLEFRIKLHGLHCRSRMLLRNSKFIGSQFWKFNIVYVEFLFNSTLYGFDGKKDPVGLQFQVEVIAL